MMLRWRFCLVAVILTALPAWADPLSGDDTYALLFKDGTLDEIDRSQDLVYRRDVENALKPDAATRDSGEIFLSIAAGAETAKEVATLKLQQGDKHRGLGRFPASVGNPMIMYFYETVVRDMAEAAGGSPYYIRNRVKSALIAPSEIETGSAVVDGREIATQTILMRPFHEDPNKGKMRGFGRLELRVTMSEEVPGWYVSLIADASTVDAVQVYRSELRFDRLEAGQ